jgi:nitrogen fixation protein FixH
VTAPQAPAEPANPASGRHWFWPVFIIGLLGTHVLMAVLMVYVATRDRSFAVEPDYYQKALHWDKTAEQQRENTRLGWTVMIEIGDPSGVLGERLLTCKVTDKAGTPLAGAVVDLVAFAHARANERASVVLLPQGNGTYQAPIRLARKGLWEFRLVISRGQETLTFTEQRRV